ncbi:MAG: CDP-diacylglycerol--serine O-phosphatidyltransferase, partial [Megasphaera sp.]|nr:CDP-diacylglycerol--serine O-phosphatidyltransferase [Megasphaera sp.]
FGKELDSLSDVVSFGAASAFLIYTYSLQTLGWVGAIPAIIYAALGGIRLARFNLNTGVVHGYFQGMPIPNGGCLIATFVISGAVLPAWLVAILVVLLGYNLVSQIHHPDFKGASPDVLHKSALAIAVIIGALVLYVDWHLVITLPFLLYIIFGLVNTAMNVAAAR